MTPLGASPPFGGHFHRGDHSEIKAPQSILSLIGMKEKSLFKLNFIHFYWAKCCKVSKTVTLLIIVLYGTVSGLGDMIYELCTVQQLSKEVHESYIKLHGRPG